MKNRKRQRENRKKKNQQKILDIRDSTDILDPTPYYAVLRMRNGIFYDKIKKAGITVIKQINGEPYMLTIRQIARTGLLSEYALHKLLREIKLPVIYVGNRALINYTKLCEQLKTYSTKRGDAIVESE
ncbi:hypothetical protein WCZ35_003045 [Listeria monocytogenes]